MTHTHAHTHAFRDTHIHTHTHTHTHTIMTPYAPVVSAVAAVGSADAAAHAAVVVAVASVVPQQYFAAASTLAIVRPARINVRHDCKKETGTCSSNEQESGSGRVREHLVSERVLFGQVDDTPDQLVPHKFRSQVLSGKRRIFEQANRRAHAQELTS